MNQKIHPSHIGNTAAAQAGAVLVISLIFLLLMTIIGVTTMQTTTLQERMAGNTRDMNLALQSAESALRDGENWLATSPANRAQADTHAELPDPVAWDTIVNPPLSTTMTTSQYVAPPPIVYVAPPTQVFYGGSQAADFAGTTSGMGPPANYYPVTAQASGGSPNAIVMLHTRFKAIE